MNYEEFAAALLEETQIKLKEAASVEISSILQNNGVELIAFTVRREGEKIAPNIYIDAFYERYQQNVPISDLAEEMVSFYCSKKDSVPVLEEFCFEWEERKSDIFYRVVNYKKNSDILKDIPHMRFLDLAVVFYCMVFEGESGIGSIRITNDHKMKWNICTKELMRAAESNTPRLFPAKIQELSQVLSDMLLWDKNSNPYDCNESLLINENFPLFYIISNERNLNGASAILYPHLLQNFADRLESDFYVLPSSIHEVIAIPVKERLDTERIRETVRHINCMFVIPEEILSDHVYYYSKDNLTLEL